jgi:DNA-binding response OmpR family regulator
VPDLYYLSADKSASNSLKEKAKLWLTKFLSKSEKELADPRVALVAEAERYNQHNVDLSGQGGAIWTWNDQTGLTSQPADASRIEEALGIGYARKALDLDPSYRPAQIELLSIALDKLYERSGPNVSVAKTAPQLQELLAGSPVEILSAVLGKAMKDNHANAALGAAKALAAHGDPSMLKLTERGAPPLLQALRSPDRRVQFAAAETALAVSNNLENYPGSSRVVDVLRYAVTSNGASKALVGLGDPDKANQIAGLLKPLGFEGQAVGSGRRILNQAMAEGNIGLIIVDATLPDPGFNYFLSQYKTNPATAGIPLLVIADKEKAIYAEETLAKLPNVKVIAAAPTSPELLKVEVDSLVSDKTKPVLSAAERSAMARAAVDYLSRIASGEIKGYDLTAADSSLIKALNDDALAVQASAALAYRPTREAQMALTTVLLNESRPAPIRAAVASSLRAHVQRFGNRLTAEQVGGIVKLAQSASNPVLREQADLTATTLQADAADFGNRLKSFIPTSGKSPPAKVEPGKEGN